jgi:hypothetical protein
VRAPPGTASPGPGSALGTSTDASAPQRERRCVVAHPERNPISKHTLKSAAQEIAEATSKPPSLYKHGPHGARKVLDDVQAAPIAKPGAEETWITIPAEVGDVPVRIVKPATACSLHAAAGSSATPARTIASCASSRSGSRARWCGIGLT